MARLGHANANAVRMNTPGDRGDRWQSPDALGAAHYGSVRNDSAEFRKRDKGPGQPHEHEGERTVEECKPHRSNLVVIKPMRE